MLEHLARLRPAFVLTLSILIPACAAQTADGEGNDGESPTAEAEQAWGGKDYGIFTATHFPYTNEDVWTHTVCGNDMGAYGGMYFGVAERSPLWPSGQCTTDSFAECWGYCQQVWNRIPWQVDGITIKKEAGGKKYVLEPACPGLPCGKKVSVERNGHKQDAYVYDACPKYHWNNAMKGSENPCANPNHVDLWISLHERLGGNDAPVRIVDANYQGGDTVNPNPGNTGNNGSGNQAGASGSQSVPGLGSIRACGTAEGQGRSWGCTNDRGEQLECIKVQCSSSRCPLQANNVCYRSSGLEIVGIGRVRSCGGQKGEGSGWSCQDTARSWHWCVKIACRADSCPMQASNVCYE